MKCSVFIAATVDGFTARLDGGIDWLFNPEYAADDGAGPFGYAEFIASVDVLVIGRDVQLEHLETVSFDNGFVQSRYRAMPVPEPAR